MSAEGSKVRAFMADNRKNLKQKFFSVLGTSSEYKKQFISGISNKIDAALSLSFASTSTETTPENVNEAKLRKKLREQHEKINCTEYSLDDHIIDYELRRIKERRAHEEILSGRYRQPAFIAHSFNVECASRKNVDAVVSSSSPIVVVENVNHNKKLNETFDSNASSTINHNPIHNNSTAKIVVSKTLTTKENNLLAVPANSCSTATSESGDNLSLCDGNSIESLEVKMWHKSETESVAHSCSSLSMDCSTDEAIFEFMRRFVSVLFTDSTAITLELKHQFGQYARVASGRMWFARFVSTQRNKTKRVNETTFYALIQYFAIILFECKECEDFLPAKHIMSLCFTFYQEVEVPGCESYREYLFNYLRDQPIWHTLRFWNAALFYALQKDKVPKSVAGAAEASTSNRVARKSLEDGKDALLKREPSRSISETSLTSTTSSSSSDTHTTRSSCSLRSRNSRKINCSQDAGDNNTDIEEPKLQDSTNLAFSQLGSLTCNMHAFGLNRDLCCDFLKKQCHILNLTKEQEKLLNDNINRLYRETDPWREQVLKS
ncbi:hypothetical protein PVAND_000468 [Polypedilum vanderplanki]|uniref:SBF1/SBF2 domain-containing protein n=1 Tax=Polypedilum vanderplanki TaxID=319348 RepID=A0A9J6BK28_POLVA|nr:hypothetical protein PVAND_000468 [Polypedilum vanderplanki]